MHATPSQCILTSVDLGDCFGEVSEGLALAGLDVPSGETSDVFSGSSSSYKESQLISTSNLILGFHNLVYH